jgi:excisionase family DNA binding protein
VESRIKKLLTTEQAAKYLTIKPWTLRAWVSQRKIPFVKIGRCVRFEQSALDNFILKNSVLPDE